MQHSLTPRIALAVTATLAGLAFVASAPPAGASGKAKTVTAVETDFHIALSQKTFTPGTYVFVAENKGATTHSLTIAGPGLKHATTPNIAPGKSAKLKVTLKKGKSDVFCPIPGHKALGMNVNLTINSGGAASASTSSGTSSSGSGGAGF